MGFDHLRYWGDGVINGFVVYSIVLIPTLHAYGLNQDRYISGVLR